MQQILFTVFNYQVRSYTFFALTALVLVFTGIIWTVRKRNLVNRQFIISLFVMASSAFVGARLLHILTNQSLYQNQPWRLYELSMIGFSIYGGIIAALLAGFICSKIFKFDLWLLGDLSAPWLGLGIVIMRIGCFLNGCCFGHVTQVPWGVSFPYFSYAHNYQIINDINHLFYVDPVHPTQLYELGYALIGAVVAWWLIKRQATKGLPLIVFGLIYSVGRLVNYYLRVLPSTFEAPAMFYPIIYGLMIIFLLSLLINKLAFKKHS